jgi:TolB-like protein/DNA-binding winged helix-turn-helix (wHTH) protein/Flp pilus assembly protein TadD
MSDARRNQDVITFGIFEADLQTRELRRKGVRVNLQDLPFRFLALLLEAPGAVVTREDLRDRLWPPGTYVDFDHSINTAANKLREALGDSAENPLFIETLPRRGYRFIAPVQRTSVAVAESPHEAESPGRRRRAVVAAAAGCVLIAVAAGYYAFARSTAPAEDSTARVRLVVLPFADYTGLPEGDYFADGLTEEVTARLGQLNPGRLGVIGRTSAMTYKNATKSIGEIGDELDTDYVLEGSIRADGGRRHIALQLAAVSDETYVWAGRYDYDATDVLALQRDVARQVASALALEVLRPSVADATTTPEVDAETYEAYLMGRFFRAKLTEPDFRRGIEYFEQAIASNPRFAPAYAGLASCFCLLAGHGLEVLPMPEAMSRTRDAALKALELDPDSAEANAVMGMVKLKDEWNGAEAERYFLRAIEINPSDSQTELWYSIYLTAVERHDEAVMAARRARELDPFSLPVNINLAQQLYEARRYEDAIAHLNIALELEPLSWGLHWSLGEALRESGRQEEAIQSLERAVGLRGGDNSLVIAALGYTYGVAGMEEQARAQLERLATLAGERYVSPAHIAAIHAGLGDTEEVFRWLERAYDVRSRSLIWLRVAHEYEKIRTDPRFQDLIARVGL